MFINKTRSLLGAIAILVFNSVVLTGCSSVGGYVDTPIISMGACAQIPGATVVGGLCRNGGSIIGRVHMSDCDKVLKDMLEGAALTTWATNNGAGHEVRDSHNQSSSSNGFGSNGCHAYNGGHSEQFGGQELLPRGIRKSSDSY